MYKEESDKMFEISGESDKNNIELVSEKIPLSFRYISNVKDSVCI